MALSQVDLQRIRPYVSNIEEPVFALAGLPEEVIAVLFAYYSRSRDDLRTNLARLLADEELDVGTSTAHSPAFRLASEKARAFHEKWVVGYGHGSVAEHAVVHLALEGVSIIASKAIEDLRLASYTEKSTRYVLFDDASFYPLPELPQALGKTYSTAARGLLRTYLELMPLVETHVRTRVARGEKQTERAYDAAVRAKTFDLLRGLLPAGTRTNLGLTANARAMETSLSKMLSSPLDEVRALARSMHREATTVAPTLVKYVAASEHRSTQRDRIAGARGAWLPANSLGSSASTARSETSARCALPRVKLLRHDQDALERIAFALLYEGADAPCDASTWLAAATRAPREMQVELVANALQGRGRFEGAPRAFEAATALVELTMDYGAYRDLQRHRMLSPYTQRLGCDLGAELPTELVEMGVADKFRSALDLAEGAWREIAESHPWEAQYIVPLAYRVRTTWQLNIREFIHVVELRSARQGHPSYRRVAQELYAEVAKAMPWLSSCGVRVDTEEYALTRS